MFFASEPAPPPPPPQDAQVNPQSKCTIATNMQTSMGEKEKKNMHKVS